MNTVKERANAKINLYLDVIAKSDNGFHDVKTIMHSLDLYDTVTVSLTYASETEVKLYLKGNRHLPIDEKNIAYKAARLFLERANLSARVNITLEKRIPIAAGLAGGSSDAAAVLRAMNKICNHKFSAKMLYKIAAELGSDVPYCLYGKSALCEGRGEILTKLSDKLRLFAVIAISSERMSTPIAYAELDRKFSNFDGSLASGGDAFYEKIIKSFEDGALRYDGLYNIFEEAIFPLCKGAEALKRKMIELGARATLMSGSGPSVFALFDDMEKANAACRRLRDEKILAYAAKSV